MDPMNERKAKLIILVVAAKRHRNFNVNFNVNQREFLFSLILVWPCQFGLFSLILVWPCQFGRFMNQRLEYVQNSELRGIECRKSRYLCNLLRNLLLL